MRNIIDRLPGDEDILSALQIRAQFAHVLTQPPPDAVSRDSIAHLARDGKSDLQIPSLHVDQNETAGGDRFTPAIDEAVILVPAQSIAARKALRPARRRAIPLHSRLGGQNLASASATGLQDIAASAGLHAGAEAVHLGSLTLLGLVSTDGTCHS